MHRKAHFKIDQWLLTCARQCDNETRHSDRDHSNMCLHETEQIAYRFLFCLLDDCRLPHFLLSPRILIIGFNQCFFFDSFEPHFRMDIHHGVVHLSMMLVLKQLWSSKLSSQCLRKLAKKQMVSFSN